MVVSITKKNELLLSLLVDINVWNKILVIRTEHSENGFVDNLEILLGFWDQKIMYIVNIDVMMVLVSLHEYSKTLLSNEELLLLLIANMQI